MKPYQVLDCDNMQAISNGIYKFLQEKTQLLNGVTGWHFLDHKSLLQEVPELLKFFISYKLIPNSASVVILTETGQLPLHIDELPVTAKINMPVINTQGWATRWYTVDKDLLDSCPTITNQFGSKISDLTLLPSTAFTFLDQIVGLDKTIVFNSRIPHEVIKIDGVSPRIIASFTFHNEPIEYLK